MRDRAPLSQTARDALVAPLRAEIGQAIEAGQAPSITVGVAREGEIIWAEGFGWADRERGIQATEHTRYAVASVAKPFVATGVMRLVERGAIDLDAPINAYLDRDAQLTGRGGDANEATVRRVLQHRAGLGGHNRFFYTDESLSPPPTTETISKYGVVIDPPDERYVYSNLGYGLLAYIKARTDGVDYAAYMRENVFAPLGLAGTTIEIERALSAGAASIYDEEGRAIPYYVFDEWGSGRVWSTAPDLLRFGMFHMKERLRGQDQILRASTIDRMVADNRSTGAEGGYYGPDWFCGLGWGGRHASRFGHRWHGHDGGMPGVSAQLKLFPDQRIAIAVLSNGRQALTYDLSNRIADALMPDYAAMRADDPTNRPPPAAASFTPGPLTGRWTGEVSTPKSSATIALEFAPDGAAHLAIGAQEAAALTDVKFEGARLSARCGAVTLPSEDVGSYAHNLRLDLALRDETLSGAIMSVGSTDRLRFNLASWTLLRRL